MFINDKIKLVARIKSKYNVINEGIYPSQNIKFLDNKTKNRDKMTMNKKLNFNIIS
tara:strand:- start:300 stop:467 length:168 start_codon:yes stop_codon:yes gene_type:complete